MSTTSSTGAIDEAEGYIHGGSAVISYVVSTADLASVRFGVSPLSELCLSLRGWRAPGWYPRMSGWLAEVRERHDALDVPVLAALISPGFDTPDVLNPRPGPSGTTFADELQALAVLDPDRLATSIDAVHPAGRPAPLRGRPRDVRDRVVTAMAGYWRTCLEPRWPALRATLQADIGYRGTIIAEHGMRAAITSLSPSLGWDGTRLQPHIAVQPHFESAVAGRGLVLVPSFFTTDLTHPMTAQEDPTIVYAVRGTAAAPGARAAPPPYLARLIGRTRAEVLHLLDCPTSTTDVAARLGITPSAANQHLRSLRDAGILQTTRSGRSVLYGRTAIGHDLVAGSGPGRSGEGLADLRGMT